MNKIGIGLITCNRPDFLEKCIKSIDKSWYSEIVIINDGSQTVEVPEIDVFNNKKNIGVGKSKNKALKYLLNKNCDYIFLVEDDMLFKDNVFAKYVEASNITGIQHFMFGYHGPANRGLVSGGKPTPRKIIDYGKIKIALNANCVGAVCFYTKKCLEDVGFIDEKYTNAFEHVDHSYMLAKKGYSTPYWWWSDLADSHLHIEEQACSENSSAIRPRQDWQENIKNGALYFYEKHGVMPAWQNAVPDTPINEVVAFLKKIKP